MKPSGDRGFALLVVLWSLVLISLLTMQILASGRTSVLLAQNVQAGAQARARADGAINEALFHLLSNGAAHWPPDGATHILSTAGGPVSIQIRLLDSQINPNLASASLIAGLFQVCGATKTQAYQLADAAIQWRSLAVSQKAEQTALAKYKQAGLAFGPPGHAFGNLAELANVIGMPSALLACATPHMSLYQPGDPDAAHADATIRQALALSGQPGAKSNVYAAMPPVVMIEADTYASNKLAIYRTAFIGIASGGVPYQFLSLSDND